jgi:hypothetical protein
MYQYDYDKGYLQRNRGEGVWETIGTFILAGIALAVIALFFYMLVG